MYGKPACIHVESDGIVYQDKRYEQQQGYENAEYSRNPAEICIKGIYQRTLIYDFIHERGCRNLMPYHLKTVRRDIFRLQGYID